MVKELGRNRKGMIVVKRVDEGDASVVDGE